MFGKYNGFVSKARVSACMYFLVIAVYHSIEIMKGRGEKLMRQMFNIPKTRGFKWLCLT
jgi:hypothetical protein